MKLTVKILVPNFIHTETTYIVSLLFSETFLSSAKYSNIHSFLLDLSPTKKHVLTIMFVISFLFCKTQNSQISFDLSKIKNEQLNITTEIKNIANDSVLYAFPAAIPGDYEIYNFGKYITNFKAFDSLGNELNVRKNDTNSYWINNKGQNFTIKYRAIESNKDGINVFFPSSTEFNKDNFYLLNLFTLIGFTKTPQIKQFDLKITRQKKYSPITSLKIKNNSPKGLFKAIDHFSTNSYYDLGDNPIIYYKNPDTTHFTIDNCHFTISNYKPKFNLEDYKSSNLEHDLTKLMKQYKKLYDTIPVKNYLFSIVENGRVNCETALYYGALEHKNNTLIYLNSYVPEVVLSTCKTVAAHEFLHIVTPLNLCHKKRLDFDYLDPHTTNHIWLYEGFTEYVSLKLLISSGVDNINGLINKIRTKLKDADTYPGYSLTELSNNVYHEPYKHFFSHFYDLGVLTCLAFDIKLVESTNGEYDLIKLVKELQEEYGYNKGFDDDKLFKIIIHKTNKEVALFIDKYIQHYNPLDYKTIFDKIGMVYHEKKTINVYKFDFKTVGSYNAGILGARIKIHLYNHEGKDVLPADKIEMLVDESNGKEWYHKLTLPERNKTYVLPVKYNGKKQTLKVTPKKHKKIIRHDIGFTDQPTEKQEDLFRKIWRVSFPGN